MKEKLLILMFFCVVSFQVSGQTAPLLQVDIPAQSVSVCDATGVTDLTAVYPNLNSTTTYVATPADVTFLPPFPTTGGTLLDATADDVWSPIVNLPFNFAFFGTFYNQVVVGSNGLISFNIANAGGYCPWAFTAPVPSPALPTNAIFGVYQDTNIAAPPVMNPAIQNVNYYVLDTGANQAPNRVFVVNYNELPQFSCNNGVGLQTSQIVIHEGTNIIDFYVDDRTCCAGWNSGSGVIGIQNATGTQGYVSPGAQTGCYALNDIHYQITPTGPAVTTSLQWYQGGTNPTTNVNGIPAGSTPVGAPNENPLMGVGLGIYTAVVTYTYSNGDTVLISDYYEVEPYQIVMDDPVDVPICTVGTSAPYTVNIDQTTALVNSATPSNPAFYDIKYYEQLIDAQSYAPNFIGSTPPSTPGAYITSGPFPQTIWVRIEDLAGSGCVNYRPLVITDGPTGTFAYPSTPYCHNLTAPQPITPTSLSPGGDFTAVSTSPSAGLHLEIDINTGEIIPSLSDIGVYTVTYTITGLAPCPNWTTTAQVEIAGCGCTVVASPDPAPLCVGTALLAPLTYTAVNPVSAVISAGSLPAGVTGVFAGGTYTVDGTPTTPGSYTYTVKITDNNGLDCTATTTIVVNPNVTLALSSAAGSNNQTVCIGATLATPLTFAVANGATGATVSGLPPGMNGAFAGTTFTISGTPTTAGPFNYTVTTVGGCSTATQTGTITVSPLATIGLTSGPNIQAVCVGTAITNVTYAVANGATGATGLTLPPGVTATFAGSTLTISGTPSVPGIYNYTVSTTGGCGVASLTGTITVNDNVTIALNSAPNTNAQTVCINTPITNITYLTTNGATNVTVTGLPAGVNGAFAGNTFTISGTPTASSPTAYNYTVTTVGGCSVASATGTITVNPDVTIGLTSAPATANQVLCINTPIINIDYTIANGSTSVTTTGLPAGVNGVLTGTTYTISGTPTVSAAAPFSYTINVVGNCGTATIGGTITVNPETTIALTSAPGTDNGSACVNTNITDIEYTISNGGTGAAVSGLPTGMTGVYASGIFTISGSTTLIGSFPYTVTTSGGCGIATATGTITITPDVTIALGSASGSDNQVLCINTPLTNIVYTITNGATSATVTGLPAGVVGTLAGNTFTISGTPTASNPAPFSYTINVVGICGTATIGGTITVNPDATIALTGGINTQTGCINVAISPIEYTVADGATGATVLGLPPGVNGILIGHVMTISGTPSAAGIYNYTVSTTGGCAVASLGGTITVQPNVTLALNSGSNTQTTCINVGIAPITYLIANAGPAGATVTGLPAGVTPSYNATTGILTISGIPTVSNPAPYSYTVTTSGGCSSASATGTITVNPNATLQLTSAAATTNQTKCIAEAIAPVVFTIGNGATSASISAGALPAGITGVFSGSTFTISGASSTAGTFNYEVTTTGGCSSQTLTGVIIIKQNVTLQLTSASSTSGQSLCMNTPINTITYVTGNDPTGVTVTGLPAGVVSNYNAATGVLTISGSGTTQGAYNYNIVTVGGCSSASASGSINLLPDATIALSSATGTDAQTVCVSQEAIIDIEYLVSTGATGASIVSGTLPSGISGSFDAATATFTLTGTPTQAGVFNYTVKTTGGFSFDTINGTMTVLALPVIDLTQDAFICVDKNGLPISDALLTTGLSAATHTFIWSDATGIIASATGSSYTATTPGVYSVKATNIAQGCYSIATTTVITSYAPQTAVAVASSYFADDQVVTLVVSPPGNYLFQADGGAWQESNQFLNLPSGTHDFVVKDKIGCGELPASILLIDYPKFFTPNNDGFNDTWNIDDLNLLSNQESSKIEIYDRYGKLLKEISPKGAGWDGIVNGYPLPSTDYWFKVYYTEDGVSKTYKAHFSLKR